MSDNKGRTLYDLLAENSKLVIFLILVFLAILVYSISKNYTLKIAGLSIESPQNENSIDSTQKTGKKINDKQNKNPASTTDIHKSTKNEKKSKEIASMDEQTLQKPSNNNLIDKEIKKPKVFELKIIAYDDDKIFINGQIPYFKSSTSAVKVIEIIEGETYIINVNNCIPIKILASKDEKITRCP